MKETVTEYDTQEVKKTVTDYETHEIETEQYVSDLTGDVIDEDDVITLHANADVMDMMHGNVFYDHYDIRSYDAQLRDECETISRMLNHGNIDNNEYNIENLSMRIKQLVHRHRNMDLEIRSKGEIHMSVSEFAELSGIDEDDIGVDDELPEEYVNAAEPEVNPLFGDSLLWIGCIIYAVQNIISLIIGVSLDIVPDIIILQTIILICSILLSSTYILSSEPSYEYEYNSWDRR